MQLLILVGVGTVSAAAVWRSSIVLEEASDSLCTHYRLPALVQGTLVAAVASSLPELASAVFSTLLHDEFELGVSVVVGSAIFNILVIPAMAGLVGRLEVGLEVIYRDAQFYVISIATLLIAFSLAVIYRPVADQRLAGEMGRVLALLPLALYGLYLFLQVEDAADHRESSGESGSESPARTWLRLVASVLVVLAAAEGLVWTALGLGAYFGTPSFLWGVTVVAVATSAPDAVISYRAAREDRPVVSVGNVLGSNIFDLLVVIPVAVLLAGTVRVDYAVSAPLMGVLTVATVVLFTSLRSGMKLGRTESLGLLSVYAAFVLWMVLETVGVTSVLAR